MTYVRGMKKFLSLFFLLLTFGGFGQSNLETSFDRSEVKPERWNPTRNHIQQAMREQGKWKDYLLQHPKWFVHFNEATGTPHRAYGPGIAQTPQQWLSEMTSIFGVQGELTFVGQFSQGKRTTYRWKQHIEGKEVLFSNVGCVL